MIGWTLCSGIGAPEMAAPWVDWRLASEIEPFPRAVLQERFGYKTPADHNQGEPLLWGDMTEVTPELARSRGVPLPDLLVAGTPCQAFSIAGLRGGVEDARGNLTLKFVETCHAIVDARPDGKLAVLWENVPGVLSDKGNAFGCFLGGLVGAMDAIPNPAGSSWPSEGMVQGARARAAWCVLDAQWFGVAQRRRRVFVVIDFGGACDPAQVLLEPDSLRGNTPPRRKTGQVFAGSAGARASHWSGGPHPALNQAHNTGGIGASNQEIFSQGGSGLVPSRVQAARMVAFGEYSEDGSASALKARDYKDATDLVYPVALGGDITHSLTGEGHDASEDGTGRGTPVVAGAICKDTFSGGAGGRPEGAAAGHFVASGLNVRRLMPIECAGLQGFPGDHCAITYNGKPAADGNQYKAYGNSMAVPVICWIMERMKISMKGSNDGL